MNGRIYRYAKIVRAIATEPKSPEQIATEAGATARAVRLILQRMHALHMVRVVQPQKNRWAPALWLLGDGPDADMRERIVLKPRGTGADLIQFSALLKELRNEHSAKELSQQVGVTLATMYGQLAAMRAAGIAYRSSWHRERRAGDYEPWWKFGIAKADAKRPQPQTKRDLSAKYRSNRRERANTLAIIRALAANASIFTRAA